MKNLNGILVLLIFAVFFISCGETTTSNADTTATQETAQKPKAIKINQSPTGYGIGDTAADFELVNIDGKMVSLSNYKDAKGFIVTFTCNHCPYAVMYEDRLIALHNKYAKLGYPVIAINPNDPEAQPKDGVEEMKVRASEKSFPFVYLFDNGQKVYPQYGATKTPHVFLLNKDRVVEYIGAIDDNARDAEGVKVRYVEDAITALEAGKKPDPNSTKAIGCSIKVKKS